MVGSHRNAKTLIVTNSTRAIIDRIAKLIARLNRFTLVRVVGFLLIGAVWSGFSSIRTAIIAVVLTMGDAKGSAQ